MRKLLVFFYALAIGTLFADQNDITIVTAYFDVGRSNWQLFERPADVYLERFGYLATLENEMVIFTSEDLVERVAAYRKGKEAKTHIVAVDFKNGWQEEREAIHRIHQNPDYIALINPDLIKGKNPEYYVDDYSLVTSLKGYFVAKAVEDELVTNELVAWVDFGYCRNMEILGGAKVWRYPFDPNKIHLFNFSEYYGYPIVSVVANNSVFTHGAAFVAGKHLWWKMDELMRRAFDRLIECGLIDDDQSLILMAYLYEPELFSMHRITTDDWLCVFRKYNEPIGTK